MNRWEREDFLPGLVKKPMSEKQYKKIARDYDYKRHDKTRLIMNDIHSTVKTITKANELVRDASVTLKVQCPIRHEVTKKWSRGDYLLELRSGPMSDERFTHIMEKIGSDDTRKYIAEWDKQREVANSIWSKVDCAQMRKEENKAT
jgi:hypothetical protein